MRSQPDLAITEQILAVESLEKNRDVSDSNFTGAIAADSASHKLSRT